MKFLVNGKRFLLEQHHRNPLEHKGKIMSENIDLLRQTYDEFGDGAVLCVKYFYACHRDNKSLTAQVVIYAMNHMAGYTWDTILITIEDVQELCAKTKGSYSNWLCTGIRIVKFGELYCLDVDTHYGSNDGLPKSFDEVRQHGDCYFIGHTIKWKKLNKRELSSLNIKLPASVG
jgi:hypothetical protein